VIPRNRLEIPQTLLQLLSVIPRKADLMSSVNYDLSVAEAKLI